MKNSYLDKFKKDGVNHEEKTGTAFDKVFEMDDENLEDAAKYCQQCKRESRWCKHRRTTAEHKDLQGAAMTTNQVVGWRQPYDTLTGATCGNNRTGMCKRTFADKGHL